MYSTWEWPDGTWLERLDRLSAQQAVQEQVIEKALRLKRQGWQWLANRWRCNMAVDQCRHMERWEVNHCSGVLVCPSHSASCATRRGRSAVCSSN
jgi:hypothetical protein